MGEEDIVESDGLKRENALLLKVIGGLGTIILLAFGGFISFWIATIETKFTNLQTQVTRQWDVSVQRSEQYAVIERGVRDHTAMMDQWDKDLKEINRDLYRMKLRLKIDN